MVLWDFTTFSIQYFSKSHKYMYKPKNKKSNIGKTVQDVKRTINTQVWLLQA